MTDHLNTVREIAKYDSRTDMTTVVNHLIYDAFGRVTAETSPAVDSLFLFTARPFDQDTQLQNNLNRWYDASVGRWLSEDPIGFAGGDGNLYRYVGNQGTIASDALGLVPISCKCQSVRYGGFQAWTDFYDVTVDCYGLAEACCRSACESSFPSGVTSWTGDWNLIGAAPDCSATPLCERVSWESLSGLDCVACCIEQNTLEARVQITLAGTGIALRPPVPKSIVLPGQASTTSLWVRQCIRSGAPKTVTLATRIAGKVGVVLLIVEGGYDCCIIAGCLERCLTK